VSSFKSWRARLFQRKTQQWFWLGLAALVLLRVYYVQEMLAALAIFSLLFLFVCAVLLVIFLVDRAGRRTARLVEPGAARLAQTARRGVAFAEELTGKHAPAPVEEPRH
jgi:hypothetical protein